MGGAYSPRAFAAAMRPIDCKPDIGSSASKKYKLLILTCGGPLEREAMCRRFPPGLGDLD